MWYVWFTIVLVVVMIVSVCVVCCRRRYYRQAVLLRNPAEVTVVHTYSSTTQPTMAGPTGPVYQPAGPGQTNYGYQSGYSAVPTSQVRNASVPPGYVPTTPYPTK